MTGSHTGLSPKVFLAAAVAAFVVIATFAGPAAAHSPNKARKAREHIRRRARSQIGAQYYYGGTGPSGFDCSGFTRWTFRKHGARLPHSSLAQFELAKKDVYRRVWKRKKLKVGDLVFHKTTGAKVGHAGIYIGDGKFISSTTSSGVRVNSIWDPYYWGPLWVGATRTPATK
jgi:cell wall-associated NlpC family hydrolase